MDFKIKQLRILSMDQFEEKGKGNLVDEKGISALRFTKGPALSWSLPEHEGKPFPQTPFGSNPSHQNKKAGQV
jgi:hypothetical protein